MFEHSYYINLDSRVDRRNSFENEIQKIGLNPTRISAITPTDADCMAANYGADIERNKRLITTPYVKNKMGCSLSHMSIIKLAKQQNFENVLIFEDDIQIDNPTLAKTQMELCFEELKTIKWDMMYFGGQPISDCTRVTNNIAKCFRGAPYTTHAYAVNHTYYDKLLSIDIWHHDVIDVIYVHIEPQFGIMVSKNLLIVQKQKLLSNLRFSDGNEPANIYMKRDWEKHITNSNNWN